MGHVDWERIRRNSLARWSNGLTEQQNAAGEALREFGSDPERGISSSPSIKTWMPQVLADPTWQSPIPWLPAGFWPYEFQARAFARLSVAKQLPRPTAIAAPEGSGKSDCFLLPILDHCARQQGMSRSGVKAVIVYASRAAAQENAARLGSLCSSVDQFQNLRPALLIDDFGSTPHVGPGHVVDSIDAMGDSPPDLLLTVPEMLERSINTKRHHRLWRETTPVSLRFVVLDDLHF
ncbi:MAG TPA: DEAD/DEAH box helicase, partial [Microthrixaceae bacterium]|nr:DEAD/DEAH box helicase [Microthrixaceae bacterium]